MHSESRPLGRLRCEVRLIKQRHRYTLPAPRLRRYTRVFSRNPGTRYLSDTRMSPREHSQVSPQFPPRGGVSQFFRCEAPFLLRHEIECRITPSLLAQKALTPPRLQASLQAPPPHHYSDLYERAMWRQPVWPVASSESPGNHGPSRKHS